MFKLLILLFTALCITSLGFAKGYDKISPLPHIPGPNCWNQALINMGLLKVHRYTSPNEFSYLVSQNCTQTHTPVEGSLGRITQNGEEFHAFTWLSETLVHAKNSFGALEIPRVMTFEEMFETYPVKSECINNNDPKVQCETEIQYYNCSKLSSDLELTQNQLFTIESTLNDILYSNTTLKGPSFRRCDVTPIENRIEKLNKLDAEIQNLNKDGFVRSDYTRAWIDSMIYQIEDIEASSRSVNCRLENEEIKKQIFPSLYLKLKELQE